MKKKYTITLDEFVASALVIKTGNLSGSLNDLAIQELKRSISDNKIKMCPTCKGIGMVKNEE